MLDIKKKNLQAEIALLQELYMIRNQENELIGGYKTRFWICSAWMCFLLHELGQVPQSTQVPVCLSF